MKAFEEEWRERFGRFAQRHEADHLVSGWSQQGLQRRLKVFAELIKGQELPIRALMLDLGCGAGTYVRFLTDLRHRVVGVDYSLPNLNRALSADPKRAGCYIGGEAYNLPFCNGCFDMVVSIGVLQALASPEQALDEMVRVLRPKGLLVVEFLNAFEVVALAKSSVERLRGQLSRVRTYSPFQVGRWFIERGLRSVQRSGVYLPPRGLPWLGHVFDQKLVFQLLNAIPGLSLAGAHAFFLVGEKMDVGILRGSSSSNPG